MITASRSDIQGKMRKSVFSSHFDRLRYNSIGWSYSEEISFPFEVYESSRPPSRKKSQLQIPPSARTQILQLWDNSLSSIVKAAREAHAVRRSREKTAAALMRREILVHTIRGIFTFPLFLSYFCSQERKQVFHHEQNFTSTPKKVVVRESDRTKSEEETKSSDSDLSVLSEFEDPEAVADQSMNSNDFSIDSDDEGVFDDHFADGLSITYHRQICLD